MDGTFSPTPPYFDQVFTLHCLKFDCNFPCIFGLLPDRKKSTYQCLFRELKSVAATMNRVFKPEQIITDFESSLMPAISVEFSEIVHSDCYFHYNQSIYRRIQSLDLATAYSSDDEIRSCCRKLMSLAMMPLQEVETSFYNLREATNSRVKQELRQLFLYFDQYWMTEVPLEIRFNRCIQQTYANIWSFIPCLVGEERRFQHTYIRITTSAQRRPKSNAADGIPKWINVLNKQYNQQKTDAEQLLESLPMLVGKKKFINLSLFIVNFR
ncbi:unnamed protein product [Rotaria sp. Silwood2]|nr:unnamed protein product [Rotaria sp. Silwood2]CAF2820447.1 unnamed protein product [Rotaria sp. Silwood2]CAF4479622.1 unnamed protein product [Rotaria sp. Silwood2]CAF4516001.1 unnamed protein product [Rotaria sp. Silwood2]CAF4574990.1 unnamed protein product [Rotaria sp. Silwood2]